MSDSARLIKLGFPDYDSMNRPQLAEECSERGIDCGELKGSDLRVLLRKDDETFGSLRPGLPLPEALATGLPPMTLATAQAQAVRSMWGTSRTVNTTDDTDTDMPLQNRYAIRPRPSTAADRSTQQLRKHIDASVSRAESVTALQHPPWIEAARAERQRQHAIEANKESVLSQGWTKSAKTNEADEEVPTEAELLKLPVPINQTKLRIMMGQPMDVIQRNSQRPMGKQGTEVEDGENKKDGEDTVDVIQNGTRMSIKKMALSQTHHTHPSNIVSSQSQTNTSVSDVDVIGETRTGNDDQTLTSHINEGSKGVSGLSVVVSSSSSSSSSSLVRSRMNTHLDSSRMTSLRPHSAAAVLSLPSYSVEVAAKNATVGLNIQRADQAEAAAKAAGMSSFSSALGVSQSDLVSFSSIASTQRRAALKARLEQHQRSDITISSFSSSSSSSTLKNTISRPSSAVTSNNATDSRIGRPGVELIRTLRSDSEPVSSASLKRMPRHVRFLNELKWQVREISLHVKQTRQELLKQFDDLLKQPEVQHH
jgi:hypothetical protein